MRILKNPFTFGPFMKIWFSRFYPGKKPIVFNLFKDVTFIKSKRLPIYVNAGKNLTKGITYEMNPISKEIPKRKLFLIYDVLGYANQEIPNKISDLKLHTSEQYPGFLVDVERFKDFSDYFSSNFSKRSRYKFKKYRNRLEASFDIRYEMYWGHMERDEYNFIFKKFRDLLIKRFKGKQVTNNNLDKEEWSFYEEVVYPMLLAKEASLYVIFQGDEPIAITLIYFLDEVMIDAITVFDVDFSKFHLGSVMVMKLIEWAFDHDMKILDFSKGDFEYKRHWMTRQYHFYYHIWYDSKYLPSVLLANGLIAFFNLKQYIRKKNINDFVHRVSYRLRYHNSSKEGIPKKFEIITMDSASDFPDVGKVGFEEFKDSGVRKAVFDILYLNQLHLNDIQVFRSNDSGEFLVKSKEKAWSIVAS
nr:GNAT family N-acetyltransferase [Allomuricauda sp.]